MSLDNAEIRTTVTPTIDVHLQVSKFKYGHIMPIFQVRNDVCVENGLGLGLGLGLQIADV